MPLWARVLIGRANRLTPIPGFTGDDLMAVWERCEGRCAISGMAFQRGGRRYELRALGVPWRAAAPMPAEEV